MTAVLVTGASGFVGRGVCEQLAAEDWKVLRVLRRDDAAAIPANSSVITVGDIGPSTDWEGRLSGVHAIVHLAARVHVMRETATDPGAEFQRVNVAGTEVLARAAVRAGVSRFVFLSTVKVHGEKTTGRPFVESDTPRPEDLYSISKWDAERRLAVVARETGLEVTVLRSPLIYGPAVKGNFLSLLKLCARGVPLPFASIENSRSLVALDNLSGAICRSLADPRAAGKTYLVSDGEDVSTPDLIRRLSKCLGRRPRLIPFPLGVLELGCRAVGHYAAYQRLTESLQVDSRAIAAELGWRPKSSLDEGLRKTVDWFVAR